MERFPHMSGGLYNNEHICQLKIEQLHHNYTGNWTVEIIGGDGSAGGWTTETTHLQIQTTQLADVKAENEDITVTVFNGDHIEQSCEAAFGVPKPVG